MINERSKFNRIDIAQWRNFKIDNAVQYFKEIGVSKTNK